MANKKITGKPRKHSSPAQVRNDALTEAVKQSIEVNRAVAEEGMRDAADLLGGKTSGNHKEITKEAIKIYKTVGIVRNAVDLMSDFAAQGVNLVHEDKEQQQFYNAWAKKIRLFNRVSHFLRSLYKTGNTIVMRHRAKLRPEDINLMKAEADIFGGPEPSKANIIPVGYTFISPANVDKESGGIFGAQYKIKLSRADQAIYKNPITDRQKKIIQQIPKDIRDRAAKDGTIIADDEMLFVGHYQKDDWDDWAEPVFFSIFDDIKFKGILRKMDESVARNIMNSIVVFKLGDSENKLPTTKTEIQKFSDLLKTPTKSKTLVWNDLIEVENTYPPVNLMLNDDKYKSVNSDILSGIGISEVLINGLGGNYANSFLSVKTLLEKLETGREVVIEWLFTELELIRTAMGWEKLPLIRFGRMTLHDERAEKALVLTLSDRGLISNKTLLSYFNEDWDVEIKRIQSEEAELRLLSPDVKRPPIQKGRPPNTNSPQEKKRLTKPKGMGEEIASVIKIVAELVAQNRKLESVESLSEEDMYNVRILSELVAPHLLNPFTANKEQVSEIISEIVCGA